MLVPVQSAGACLALLCFLKGKPFAAILGVLLPLVAIVGAVRLAKPGSRWARRYGPSKLERAHARFAGAPG